VIAIDASLWFDYPRNYERIASELTGPLKHASSLFMAVANNPFTPGFGRSAFHRDRLQQFARQVVGAPAQTCTSPAATSRRRIITASTTPPSIRDSSGCFRATGWIWRPGTSADRG
jgi:hypothetical protein